jgi:predicted GIY-YIG superfamily endonuclease
VADMTLHNGGEIPLLRYVYILEVDNHNQKSQFYGFTKCYYPGMTADLGKRLMEHIRCVNSKFLSDNFRWASKKLVYVDYVHGPEAQAIGEEYRVKKLSKDKKEELIKSERNKLVSYIPLKAIILKKYQSWDEQICIQL